MKCSQCGAEEAFAFKCSYCGLYFCGEHRLPENHACTAYAYALPPRQYTSTSQAHTTFTTGNWPAPMSRQELTSFVIGAALVWLVGVSMMLGLSSAPYVLLVNSLLFVISFLGHEFAHKVAAHRHGLWAEFRLNGFGALLTALSVILPIKFVAPGAVVLDGYGDEKTLGKVAAWGPLVNIAMSTIMFPLVYLVWYGIYVWPAFYVSSFIAVFNLIPVAILDGKKVFDWNRGVWVALFVISLSYLAVAWLLPL